MRPARRPAPSATGPLSHRPPPHPGAPHDRTPSAHHSGTARPRPRSARGRHQRQPGPRPARRPRPLQHHAPHRPPRTGSQGGRAHPSGLGGHRTARRPGLRARTLRCLPGPARPPLAERRDGDRHVLRRLGRHPDRPGRPRGPDLQARPHGRHRPRHTRPADHRACRANGSGDRSTGAAGRTVRAVDGRPARLRRAGDGRRRHAAPPFHRHLPGPGDLGRRRHSRHPRLRPRLRRGVPPRAVRTHPRRRTPAHPRAARGGLRPSRLPPHPLSPHAWMDGLGIHRGRRCRRRRALRTETVRA
ncbi:hypothetical protein SGPA1_40650 [Streptomyces misionensis JCM 4497]